MSSTNSPAPKLAPPAKAASFLQAQGYPIGERFLREAGKTGKIAAVKSGARLYINIESAIRYLDTGYAAVGL